MRIMSRIGNRVITIPSDVTITLDGNKLTVSMNIDFGKYGNNCKYTIETHCIKSN